VGDAFVFELEVEEEGAGDGDEDGLGEDVGDVAVDGGGLVGGEDADGGLGIAEAAGGDVEVEGAGGAVELSDVGADLAGEQDEAVLAQIDGLAGAAFFAGDGGLHQALALVGGEGGKEREAVGDVVQDALLDHGGDGFEDAGVASDGLMEGAEGDFEEHALVVGDDGGGARDIGDPQTELAEHLALAKQGLVRGTDLDLDHAGDGEEAAVGKIAGAADELTGPEGARRRELQELL